MHGCTQYTQSALILHFSSCSTHTYTLFLWEIPFFYFLLDTHDCIFTPSLSFSRFLSLSHAPTHTNKLLQAMYHSGLSCCLSNQCMGSFQLQWSEHFIPFHSSPLPSTQTLQYMPETLTNTHTHNVRSVFSPHALNRRDTDLPSISKRLMCLLGQNEILCHYKVIRYTTPE